MFVPMRMNPEYHKPDDEYPDGRSKMRWIIQGYAEPQSWKQQSTDAPTPKESTINMLIAEGEHEVESGDEDVVSTGDIGMAFLYRPCTQKQCAHKSNALLVHSKGPCVLGFKS